MLRATTEKGIRVLKQSKHITQNMLIKRLSQNTYSSTEHYCVDNAIKSYVQFRNGSLIQPIVFHKHNRKFSRSSSLLHDIKCVANSYYEDIGLDSTATAKEIKEAFYRLSKECHPDRVGQDNVEALLQFQAISEAYATLSDPRLRRQYDRGVLGRASSAADRDLSKHKVEGDAFIQGRAAFREQFGSGHKKLSKTERLDSYTTRATSRSFNKAKDERTLASQARPNATDEQGRCVVQWPKPSRATRQSAVGNSYAEWTSGNSARDKKGGGGGFVMIVFLAILIIIVRKLM